MSMPDRARDAPRGSNINLSINGQSTQLLKPASKAPNDPKDPHSTSRGTGSAAALKEHKVQLRDPLWMTNGARDIFIDDSLSPSPSPGPDPASARGSAPGPGPVQRRQAQSAASASPPASASASASSSSSLPTSSSSSLPLRPQARTSQNTLLDLTIAVLGAAGAGKSSFIRTSFDLYAPPTSPVVSKVIYLEGTPCLVRLVELSIDQVHIEQDGAITWPDAIAQTLLPTVDAVFLLYDVADRRSFGPVPETLNAIYRSNLPCTLVSYKCDLAAHLRELDPLDVEKQAQALVQKITTLQTSFKNPAPQKQAILDLIYAICQLELAQKDPAHPRHSDHSPAHVSIERIVSSSNNTRASLGYLGDVGMDDGPHGRHDSSVDAEPGNKTITDDDDDIIRSFLNAEGSRPSASISDSERTPSVTLEERTRRDDDTDAPGYTFDSLVDRLLLLPKSKADGRFRAIFLALYRKFAAPGQLLEAIVYRFEALEGAQTAFMSRTVSQLRYLSIIEQWIATYPGDFAYPQTNRRTRTFVSKLASTRIFSAAAMEMSADLDLVVDNDDTDWACCDKDWDRKKSLASNASWQSKSSTWLDDAEPELSDNLSPVILDMKRSASEASASAPLPLSYGLLHTVDLARRQAESLVPIPRNPINKVQWRTLLETPNDTIAKELTRIDWVMFSSIRPRDLVRHVSLPAAQKNACKSLINVNRMIDHFNHLRDWVANFILFRDKAKHRVLMLEKFMQVARKLRDLNNYNALGAFLAGINSAAVHRLNATRELLTPEIQKDWMKLEILMSPTRSYSAYRLAWENSSGERIPFVPLPLRDLVGSQEGNKTFVGEADARINWDMFEVMGEVIVGIQKAQGQPYHNLSHSSRQDELRSLILHTVLNRDDEALYDRSVQLEPSNASDRRGIKEFFKRSTTMMG